MSEQATRCMGVDVGGTFANVILSDGEQFWSAEG